MQSNCGDNRSIELCFNHYWVHKKGIAVILLHKEILAKDLEKVIRFDLKADF